MIDSHILATSLDTARYPVREGTEGPAGTMVEALADLFDAGALAGGLLVQQGRVYGFDNALVCDLAAADPRLRALGMVDARLPGAGETARSLLARPGVVGLRFMEPEKDAGLGWLDGEHAQDCWRALADSGALATVHAFGWNRTQVLPAALRLAQRFPAVPVVIDNMGNGPLEQGAPDYGIDALVRPLIDLPQVCFKFTDMTLGLIAKAGLDPAQVVTALVGLVGAERLLWGSDVLPPGQGLADAITRARQATDGLLPARAHAVLYGTARALFGFQ